jgi:SsrA-binding protein
MAEKAGAGTMVAQNRRARFNYEIEDTLEVGLVLQGSEVKSLRGGSASIAESYAGPKDGELYLLNAHIPEYKQSGQDNHAPRRPRKLLVHKREMERLMAGVQRGGYTLVPLRLYFNDRGIAKLELALAKGKKRHDKRQSEKARDWKRQKDRLMRGDHG